MKNTRSTNDDNSITKKVFDEKTESVFYYRNNREHNSETFVDFPTILSRNTFVSNNSHFNVKNWKKSGKLVIQVSGIYEMYYGQDAQG